MMYNTLQEMKQVFMMSRFIEYTKRLLNLQLLIEESLGIQVEYNNLSEEILFRSMLNQMGVKIDLFTGKKELSLSGIGWETHNLKIISNGLKIKLEILWLKRK